MIGFKLDQVKGMFFDRKKVMSAVDRATRRVLSRFGAFVRTRARSSLRPAPKKKLKEMTHDERARYRRAYAIAKRKGQPLPKRPTVEHGSPAGKPPYSRTGLLRRFILFAYEPSSRNVVIGPARLNQTIGDAPAALEYGGTSRVTSGGRRGRRVVRTVTIAARPFMHPAFETEKPKLPGMWANSVKP